MNQSAVRKERFYRVNDLIKTKHGVGMLGGVCGATLWRWVKNGTFPASTKLGPNFTAFDAQAVDAWIDAKISGAAK